MPTPDLSHDRISEIRQAFNAKRIVYSSDVRRDLLNGIHTDFVARLPTYPGPSYQLLADLRSLNETSQLENGQVPLMVWLENAVKLFPDSESTNPFEEALTELKATQTTLVPPPVEARKDQPQAVPSFSTI